MTIVTPSTGATRPSPMMRLNTRGLVQGERVLFSGFSRWTVDQVAAPMDKQVRVGAEVVMYRAVVGVIPAGTDEAELVAQLRHADARRAELIKRANDAHRERVQSIVTAAKLEKEGPPPPIG